MHRLLLAKLARLRAEKADRAAVVELRARRDVGAPEHDRAVDDARQALRGEVLLVRERGGERADRFRRAALPAQRLGRLPRLARLQGGLELLQLAEQIVAAAARGEVALQRLPLPELVGVVQVVGQRRLVVVAVQRVLSFASLR